MVPRTEAQPQTQGGIPLHDRMPFYLAFLLILCLSSYAEEGAGLSLDLIDLRRPQMAASHPINQQDYRDFDRRGGPLELQGTCPGDVTAIRIDALPPQRPGVITASDSYVLKNFRPGMTSFRYRISPSLGNLNEGTTQFTVTATRADKPPLSRTFSVFHERFEKDWRDGGPKLLPTKSDDEFTTMPNEGFTFAKMTSDHLDLGVPFPQINDGSTFRMLDDAYLRLDGSVLKSPTADPPWVRTYPFTGGIAWVMTGDREGGDWAAIDSQGQILFHSPYPRCEDFVAGFALVQDSAGRWGVIDARGETIVKPRYNQLSLPPKLKPKTLITDNPAVNQPPLLFLLPSGQEWLPRDTFIGSAYQDAQGQIFRVAESQTESNRETIGRDTTLQFTDEVGKVTRNLKLPGVVDREDWYPDPGVLVVEMNVENWNDVHRLVVNPKGQPLYSLPAQTAILRARSDCWLMAFGVFQFSFDAKAQSLVIPFDPAMEWLDPATNETLDATGQFYRVTDEVLHQSWDIPQGFKAIGRLGDFLILGAGPVSRWPARPQGFYAELNDSGVRLRSEPSLSGKVIGSFKGTNSSDDDNYLIVDKLSQNLTTIDGFQAFWVHLRADPRRKTPEGWVFGRYITPANQASW